MPVKIAGELSTVELIDEAGRKSALFGGLKAGGYWAAQELPDGNGVGLTLLIGEGVATVLSAKEATGNLAIAARQGVLRRRGMAGSAADPGAAASGSRLRPGNPAA